MPPPTPADALPAAARLGQALRRLGWVLAVVVLTQSLQIARFLDDGTGLRQLMALPVVVLFGFGTAAPLHAAGASLMDRALRRRSANAAAVLAADPRPPVLYLRPFDDDLQQARTGRWLRLAPAPYLGLSAEQQIARVLGGIGPLVAIGRPGEALPPLGFARLYVHDNGLADDGWQGAVRGLLDRAAAVVLVAGSSPGLMWELGQVLQRVPRQRVVLVVPAWPRHDHEHDHERFRQQVQQRLGITLPPLSPGLGGPFPHDVRALIVFDTNGQPRLHEWHWGRVPAAEQGRLKRLFFRLFGGRGLPLFGRLDALTDQQVDRALAHLLRPHGIPAPDLGAAQAAADMIDRQARLALWVALVVAGVIALAVLAGALLG